MPQAHQSISELQQKIISSPPPQQSNEKNPQNFKALSTLGSIAGLDDIDKQVALASTKESQEQSSLEIEPIPIHEQSFQKAYQELTNRFHDKLSIQAILQRNDYTIQQNQWIQTVISEIEKNQFELVAEELLSYFKNALHNPTIRLVIHVDTAKAQQFAQNAPTKQEILYDLINQYPDLQEFIQLFDLSSINQCL